MGLLNRLQNQDDTPPASTAGVLGRIQELRSEDAPDESRSESGASFVDGSDSLSVDPAAAMRALLKELHRLEHGGIETPSHLFALLHRHLAIQEGAILVPEPADAAEYVPVATAGLDATTRARLRLDKATVHRLATRHMPYFIVGESLGELQPYLSASLYRRLKRVALLPFFQGATPIAVLLLFDSPVLNFEYEILNMFVAALGDSISTVLFQSRQRRIGSTTNVLLLPHSVLAETIERAEKSAADRNRDPLLIEMDLRPVADAISRETPFLDEFRLANDIEHVVANIFQDVGSIVRIDNQRLVLCTVGGDDLDAELAISAATQALQSMFGVRDLSLSYQSKTKEHLVSPGSPKKDE